MKKKIEITGTSTVVEANKEIEKHIEKQRRLRKVRSRKVKCK